MNRQEKRIIRDCKVDLERCEKLATHFIDLANKVAEVTGETPAIVIDTDKYFGGNYYEINYVKTNCIRRGFDFCVSRYDRIVIEKITPKQ